MNDIRILSLLIDISQYDEIILYGTGNYAHLLSNYLRQAKKTIKCCIETVKKRDFFEGEIPVYSIDDVRNVEISDSEKIIIVAVRRPYSQEIKWELKLREINNYILLEDYLRNWNWAFLEMNNLNNKEFMRDVGEWLILNGKRKWEDLLCIEKEIDQLVKKKKEKKKLVFLVSVITPRIIKIIGALQPREYSITVILFSEKSCAPFFEKALVDTGVSVLVCHSEAETIYTVWKERPFAIHIFNHGGDFNKVRYNMIRRKELFSPIVYEVYDIMNHMYINVNSNALYEEKFCIENADGVVNRGYELKFLEEQCGFKISGKKIQFLDYCNDTDVKLSQCRNTELSICYAGHFTTSRNYPDPFSTAWDYLIELCEKKHCHFHIYASNYDEREHEEYVYLEKKLDYFHFHEPVPFENLREEIRKFDYGVLPLRKDALDQDIIGRTTKYKLKYAVTNKFYDYLDAGLPIIAYGDRFFCKEFEDRGVLLYRPVEEYDFDEFAWKKIEMKNRVLSVQKEMQISKHINRLCSFYDSIADERNVI